METWPEAERDAGQLEMSSNSRACSLAASVLDEWRMCRWSCRELHFQEGQNTYLLANKMYVYMSIELIRDELHQQLGIGDDVQYALN